MIAKRSTWTTVLLAALAAAQTGCARPDPATSRLEPDTLMSVATDDGKPAMVSGLPPDLAIGSMFPDQNFVDDGTLARVTRDAEPDSENRSDFASRGVSVRLLEGKFAGQVVKIWRKRLRPTTRTAADR